MTVRGLSADVADSSYESFLSATSADKLIVVSYNSVLGLPVLSFDVGADESRVARRLQARAQCGSGRRAARRILLGGATTQTQPARQLHR
jgi:hypothetical protein